MKTLIAFALCFLASFSASAVTETNKTIISMGAEDLPGDKPRAFVILSPALARNCLYGVAYVKDISTPGGMGLYAVLLRAYTQSKPFQRIDYDQDSTSGLCYISLIMLGT